MQHAAALRIKLREQLVEIEIETAFIAVVPKQNARMVHVARHHFLDQLRADFRVVMPMPARMDRVAKANPNPAPMPKRAPSLTAVSMPTIRFGSRGMSRPLKT